MVPTAPYLLGLSLERRSLAVLLPLQLLDPLALRVRLFLQSADLFALLLLGRLVPLLALPCCTASVSSNPRQYS
jgi:hypothetical protein